MFLDLNAQFCFHGNTILVYLKICGILEFFVAGQTPKFHKFSNTTDPLPPPDPRGGVKIQLFQNMIKFHYKLKGKTHAATW